MIFKQISPYFKPTYLKQYLLFCIRQPILRFLHFMLFVLLIYILIEWNHENNLYRNIGRMARIQVKNPSDTAVVQEAMTSINALMQSRSALFRGYENLSWKQNVFQSVDIHLMYGSGACGGYSMVLARTLQLLNYDVRIGQLKLINSGWGGHVIIEYYSNILNKWVMIDPLFTWIPRTKSGNMASVKYVEKHMSDFEDQMPEDFKEKYRYSNVRYTNWDKYGGVAKPFYYLVRTTMGKTYADSICLRMYKLSSFPLIFLTLISGYLLTLAIGFWRFKRM